jgi:hypothetical protein
MRIALVSPTGCAFGPNTPLELLYARQMLLGRGVECVLLATGSEGPGPGGLIPELAAFAPTDIFFTTTPGYRLWPEPLSDLQASASLCRQVRLARLPCNLICVGPHASCAPEETLLSLLCDAVVVGEPEEAIAEYRGRPRSPHFAFFEEGALRLPRRPAEADLGALPRLDWSRLCPQDGAQVEFSRGNPWPTGAGNGAWAGSYRERPLERVLAELEALRGLGVAWVSFSDQVFGLGRTRELLRLLAAGSYPRFRARSRPWLWDRQGLELLAKAGCIELVGTPPLAGEPAQAEKALGSGRKPGDWRARLAGLVGRLGPEPLRRKPIVLQRTD